MVSDNLHIFCLYHFHFVEKKNSYLTKKYIKTSLKLAIFSVFILFIFQFFLFPMFKGMFLTQLASCLTFEPYHFLLFPLGEFSSILFPYIWLFLPINTDYNQLSNSDTLSLVCLFLYICNASFYLKLLQKCVYLHDSHDRTLLTWVD